MDDNTATCPTCGKVSDPDCFVECVCACHDGVDPTS